MCADIEEVRLQCDICMKLVTTTEPPKSAIHVTVNETFQNVSHKFRGPMIIPKDDTLCKKYIIAAVEDGTR